jgi:cell division septal protein FtsQ|tara:strand:- start:2973 stop:3644 length:672 start_codon:yes stop_codon:yes gene_type:complete
MPLLINKKSLIYLFIFFFLGTYNNKKFPNFGFPKIKSYKVSGLSEFENNQINQDLTAIQNQNLFFLKKNKVSKIINSHKNVEKFFVFKKYPSALSVKIKKTNYLALTKKNGKDYYIGSNGNMIEAKNDKVNLPFLFGVVEITEFLKFKKIIDDSKLNYKDIKNLYYFKSKRWDIETKNDLIIKLPIKKLQTSLEILSIIKNKKEFRDFRIIDLRQDNQIAFNE